MSIREQSHSGGVGGTGKSFLIETIQMKMEIWKNKESLTCAVAAPTGLAAFNVGGVTVHRLLQLPVEQLLRIGHCQKKQVKF